MVKSLHDEPAKSWRATKLEEEEKYFESQKNEWDRRQKEMRKKQQEVSEKLSYYYSFLNKDNLEAFKELDRILTDKWEYVLTIRYSEPEIIAQEDFEWGKRLLTVFGDSQGDITYRINRYGDGSGSDSRQVYFCNSKEEALAIWIDFANTKEYLSSYDLEFAKKNGLKLQKAKVKAYYDQQKNAAKANMEQKEREADAYRNQLKELEKLSK